MMVSNHVVENEARLPRCNLFTTFGDFLPILLFMRINSSMKTVEPFYHYDSSALGSSLVFYLLFFSISYHNKLISRILLFCA